MQVNKKLKKISIANLIAGYCMVFVLIMLVLLNRAPAETNSIQEVATSDPEGLFIEKNETKTEIVYIDREVPVVKDHSVYSDRLTGVVLGDDPHVAVVRNGNLGVTNLHTDHLINERDIIIDGRGRDFIAENDLIYENHKTGNIQNSRGVRGNHVGRTHDDDILRRNDRGSNTIASDIGVDRDRGLLDRRLKELESEARIDEYALDKEVANLEKDRSPEGIGFENLTLAGKGDDVDFGEIDLDSLGESGGKPKGGELYAYNFPRLGVGAGIGSSSLGAGAGGGAGIGAGVGEAVLNGQTVPTLGGIGTSPVPAGAPGSPSAPNSGVGTPGQENAPESPLSSSDGVGGLVSGAGAGGAAGLVTRQVTQKLGLGAGNGCAEHGGDCQGHHGGHGKNYDYKHLPKDGSLHIMIHVDGSGSILNTRKQLDIMKETLLKDALLPYYNNNEKLYNQRVTIISSSGERTLRFFSEAAKKDNVLAVAFQDEAQPAYHLPNFNRKPEEHYLDDLGKLKASLNGYGGTYRGIMFQVDRGRTFAKSFKEFVGNAFKGEGYLDSASLKKYYRDNNNHHIKNKDGVVFSDEYHAKDSGDPKYYLDLIFEASKKVGLDLDIYGAGLTDGQYNLKNEL